MHQGRPYSCCRFAPQPFQERHQAFWCGATTQRQFSALPATEMASPATPLSHAIGAQTTAVCAAAAPMGQHHLPLETQRASPVARILPRESPSRTSHRGLQLHRPRTKYPPRILLQTTMHTLRCSPTWASRQCARRCTSACRPSSRRGQGDRFECASGRNPIRCAGATQRAACIRRTIAIYNVIRDRGRARHGGTLPRRPRTCFFRKNSEQIPPKSQSKFAT